MFESYLRARRVVALAFVALLLASAIIVTAFYRQITVSCQGGIEEVPVTELPPRSGRNDILGADDAFIDYDQLPSQETSASKDPRSYRHVRVWLAETRACKSELPIKWDPAHNPLHHNRPGLLNVYHNRETGLYVVHEQAGADVIAFRRTNVFGRKFQWRNALETNNVSMLIFFGAVGALVGAFLVLQRAGSYALTMRDWRQARRREDGVLEDANGAVIARLGWMYFRQPDVLVNPKLVDGRSIYRELPILNRGDFAPGSHHEWTNGTYRRFRDAKVLAFLAAITTALAVGAQFVA